MDFLTLLLGSLVLLIIYYFKNKQKSHFAGIPQVPSTFLVGNFGPVLFNKRSMAEQIHKIYNTDRQAKYIGYHELTNPIIMVRDLNLVKFITIKNFEHFLNHSPSMDKKLDPLFAKNVFFLEDDNWRNARPILSRTFSSARMSRNFELISVIAENFAHYMATTKTDVELQTAISRFGTEVAATVYLGIKVNVINDPTNDFHKMMLAVSTINPLKLFIFRNFPWLSRLLKLHLIDPKASIFMNQVVKEAIAAKKLEKNNTNTDNVLQLMLQAQQDGNKSFQTIEDMLPHAFIFCFGSVDTATAGSSFAIYELAKNKQVQKRLQMEIDEVTKKYNGLITYDVINKMKYLEAVLCESLRLYPPGGQADRMCNKEIDIPPALPGLTPYTVKPGSIMVIPIYSIHHDEEYFKDPEVFDPERFIDGDKNKEPMGFMPFGMGQRHCIAQRMATLMAKVLIFYLLKQCNLSLSDKHPFVLKNSLFVMESKHGLWIKAETRK